MKKHMNQKMCKFESMIYLEIVDKLDGRVQNEVTLKSFTYRKRKASWVRTYVHARTASE